jgi:hypothetical protein
MQLGLKIQIFRVTDIDESHGPRSGVNRGGSKEVSTRLAVGVSKHDERGSSDEAQMSIVRSPVTGELRSTGADLQAVVRDQGFGGMGKP